MAFPLQLNSRVRSGLLIGALVTAGALLGGWFWVALTVIHFRLAYRELMALMAAKGIAPSRMTIITFSLTCYLFAMIGWGRHLQEVMTVGVIFTFGWLLLRKTRASISDIGGTLLMIFYLGFLPAHFILLRNLNALPGRPFWEQPGLHYLMLILFIVSASDVFAYYGGKRFGKTLLSPQISPKKTREGAVSAVVMAMAISIAAAIAFGIHWWHGMVLGLVISCIAQIGDLSESLIKRDAGLKDSGSLIPGHGGLLDRTDSYIFSGAVGYYYILWFVLHAGLARDVLGFFHR